MNKKLKKTFVILGVLALFIITSLVLVISLENWSGAREWEKVRDRMIAENIELDYKKLLPEMPPEEENFARTPLIASITDFTADKPKTLTEATESSSEIVYEQPELRQRFLQIKLPDTGNKEHLPNWQAGKTATLDSLRKALNEKENGGESLQDWLNQFEKEFTEIDTAAQNRPYAQIKPDVGETFVEQVSSLLPFTGEFRDFQAVQTVRASEALKEGNTAEARKALTTSLQLYRTVSSHPTLICYLVGQISLDQSLSIIWEGMEMNQWTAEDLKWIQTELSQIDTLKNLERSLTLETVVFQIGAADFLKTVNAAESAAVSGLFGSGVGNNSKMGSVLATLIPSGIWDHNKAFGCRLMLDHAILPVRERRIPEEDAIVNEFKDRNVHNFLAAITVPAVSGVAIRGYQSQVAVDLAVVACALERFQLKNGTYPENLGALVPEFIDAIPLDLMSPERPVSYKKGALGDRYRIYSVGQNKVDDGGEVIFKKKSKARRDPGQGDWAWGYQFNIPEGN